jgi:hypothetical protein
MPTFRLALVVVCLAAPSLMGQAAVEPAAPVLPSRLELPETTTVVGEGEAAAERRLGIATPASTATRRTVTPKTNSYGGSSGALNVNETAGVEIEAYVNTPNIWMQLGKIDATASFDVTNFDNLSLFKVRGDAYAILRRDQDAFTALEINNANPGSSGTAASKQIRFFQGTTQTAKISSTGSGSTGATGGGNALQLWNFANGSMVIGTNDVERMRIFPDGDVSIGAPVDNNARLTLLGGTAGGQALVATQVTATIATAARNDYGMILEARDSISTGVANNGSVVGAQIIGRNNGLGSLYAAVGGRFTAGNIVAGTVTNAYGVLSEVVKGPAPGVVVNGYGLYVSDIQADNGYGVYQIGADDVNVLRGKVVIGQPIVAPDFVPPVSNALNVNGGAHFNGTVTGTNIKARYQDVAEWVPSTTDLLPGTVVILNRERNNEVMASAAAYDTAVAGVVSSQPGLSLGIEGDGKEQIATTGRVKVRVDARVHPVGVGDLLVTSETPGAAMRSEPMEINGRKFHQPGTILGKALEPLAGGVGEILVLLSLQ